MSARDAILIALGFAIALCTGWVFNALDKRAARRRAPATPAARAPQILLVGKSPEWTAMPGHRIELGSTGFVITLNVEPSKPWYSLHGPEGQLMAHFNDLPSLKATAERFAAEREEFTYRGSPPSFKATQ